MSHRERNGPQGRGYSAAGRLARAKRRDFDQVKSNDFFAELKQRNVYKVGLAYAAVCWQVVQVATQVFPFFEIPNWAVRLIVIGFPIALVIAWAFELTACSKQLR
jgi:hypothetical protein